MVHIAISSYSDMVDFQHCASMSFRCVAEKFLAVVCHAPRTTYLVPFFARGIRDSDERGRGAAGGEEYRFLGR